MNLNLYSYDIKYYSDCAFLYNNGCNRCSSRFDLKGPSYHWGGRLRTRNNMWNGQILLKYQRSHNASPLLNCEERFAKMILEVKTCIPILRCRSHNVYTHNYSGL